jgi:hypothetical protein
VHGNRRGLNIVNRVVIMKYHITQRDQVAVLGATNDYDGAKRAAEAQAKQNPGQIFDVYVIQSSTQCKVMDPFTIEVVK